MSYKIGSFNVRNLSFGAGASRDLDLMAGIIKEFDVIALQEVLSEGKILEGITVSDVSGQAMAYEYSLRSRLGDNWDMCWLDPKTDSKWYPYTGDDSRGEGYAFLWRKDKFKCPLNEHGKVVRPRIIHQYKTDSSRGEMKLIRDPGYARLQLVDMPNAEIRLITTHIVYKKPSEDNLSKAIDFGSYVMRQNEFNVLARSIYTSVSEDHNDINCIVPYTIILGDYNLNLFSSGAGSPFVPAVMVVDSKKRILGTEGEMKNGFYFMHTTQADLSTVNKDADNYASNYDHFTFDERTKNSIVEATPHRVNAVERAGDFKTYKDKVSDHIPVMLEISMK
ncbi:hypothetical protein [Butyrivibrio sp. LC3010]|uniref:hypothetical protein n=1 Tax=Butyrivibrio sp. LC3010 TaxID=1280680 RepID=UPI0003FAAA8B|nr:hypothetical protein [Butyrivibrio sp. LC3010]